MERVVLRKNSGGYREYRIPGILATKDALLMTCEARAEDMGDWGDIDIIVLRIKTGGEIEQVLKIGESHLPADGTMRTYNNPVLIPDGEKVHLIYHKNYEKAFIVTSSDGGINWTSSREITESFREFSYAWTVCATGPGHGIQMKKGRLVAPIWLANGEMYEDGLRRKHMPSVAGCIYSDDHGVTWHAGALAEELENGNETTVAELEDGRLLFNYRNTSSDMHRRLGVSSDGGETIDCLWMSSELQDPRCCGGMASGKGYVAFSNCDSNCMRVDLTVKCSFDGGKSWVAFWKVDSAGGYSDIAIVDDEAYIFYERRSYETQMIEELVLANKKLDGSEK